jgi:hypothetical protein
MTVTIGRRELLAAFAFASKTPSKKLTALPPCSVPADTRRPKKAPGVPGLQVVSNKGECLEGMSL